MARLATGTSTTYVVGALLVIFVIKILFFSSIPSSESSARSGPTLRSPDLRTLRHPNAKSQVDMGVAVPIRDNFDAFAEYSYHDICKISSLDIHKPFEPLCQDKKSLVTAMSSGGRIGMDSPYMTRGCDMRWYTTEEACSILEKFDRVVIIGDSMMRQMLGALYVILRKDIGYGGVTNWNFNDQERNDCFCNKMIDVKSCSIQTIYSSDDIVKWDPNSFACDAKKVKVLIELQVQYPQPDDELDRFVEDLSDVNVGRKVAFIFGQGLWNELDVQATISYLERAESAIKRKFSEYEKDTKTFPRLFVTPNAAGHKKPDMFIMTQGNKPLVMFEHSMYDVLPPRGYDVLGTWNMSIQGHSYDGVHCDLKGNLLKAMMVLNWLDKVGQE
ncbi:hypothetical protein V1512DRAFT_262427 [Lipomyces arxii]|uniref:uncharacterized protein n=1 Tax=Lipomyces arxii TaxID=56418 RepID=UPI0034CD22CB